MAWNVSAIDSGNALAQKPEIGEIGERKGSELMRTTVRF